ncbi:hypothetical protein CI610_00094 [invertebrate metagenome]|uniref:Uncharacterized protein n=1 Tax=invertebrate metagenome TaxID=1711999 RepID=A0A2H9TCF8_9ZZZZ
MPYHQRYHADYQAKKKYSKRKKGLLTLVAILLWLVAFYAGTYYALQAQHNLTNQYTVLSQKTEILSQKNASLTKQLGNLKSQCKINQAHIANDQKIIKNLEQERDQLLQELCFYHDILAPENKKSGIHLQNATLLKTNDYYHFRIIITHVHHSPPCLQGHLSLMVLGQEKGEAKEYSLLSLAGLNASHPLKFKYFQAVPSRTGFFSFKLPEAFIPQTLIANAYIRNGYRKKIEQKIPWDSVLSMDNDLLIPDIKTLTSSLADAP